MGLIFSKLRVLMAEKGLNIQKVKDKTTLSRTTISNLYNNNGSGVQFDTLMQLCELFNCQPGDLLEYSDISVQFEVVETDPFEFFTDEEEHEGKIYTGSISFDLKIICDLYNEGHTNKLKFVVGISADLDPDKNVTYLSIEYKSYQKALDPLNLPYYIENYVDGELDTFIDIWIDDFVRSTIEY